MRLGKPLTQYQAKGVDIMTGSKKTEKRSKADLEHLVKSNGGKIVQNNSRPGTVCIGDHRRYSRSFDCSEVLMAL